MNLIQQFLVFQESVSQVTDFITRGIYKLHCVRVAFLDALCEVSNRNVSCIMCDCLTVCIEQLLACRWVDFRERLILRNVSCIMCACLTVCIEQLLACRWVDFRERLILRIFTKLCRKNLILMKVGLKKKQALDINIYVNV